MNVRHIMTPGVIKTTDCKQPLPQKRSRKMSKSTPITLRLDTKLYDAVKAIAAKEDIPASYVIRRLLRRGLGIAPTTTAGTAAEDLKMPEDWEV